MDAALIKNISFAASELVLSDPGPDLLRLNSTSTDSSVGDSPALGSSPVSVLPGYALTGLQDKVPGGHCAFAPPTLTPNGTCKADAKWPTAMTGILPPAAAAMRHATVPQPLAPAGQQPQHLDDLTTVSMTTLVGCSEILGHSLEDRTCVSSQQDEAMTSRMQATTSVPLRDASQRPLFVVAPLDVLVTRDGPGGSNRFHIIEINGTGYAGVTNCTADVVHSILQGMRELPQYLHQEDVTVLVASSGQESVPPVSRTMHEKMLYVEALRKGFADTGRSCKVINMTKLERSPASMPVGGGPLVVLGYMKQFRRAFQLTDDGRLMLHGRQVHAGVNDRFVLNIMHQFNHEVDLKQFRGYNACYTAGADKGVAYTLYNKFFGAAIPTINRGGGGGAAPAPPTAPPSFDTTADVGLHHDGDATGDGPCAGVARETAADGFGIGGGRRFGVMTDHMQFERAFTRDQLLATVQAWLEDGAGPVVIKPQGTGCGHGIEFFFDADEAEADVAARIDGSIQSVTDNYLLACGGLPYTVCGYLNTASVHASTARWQHMEDHKFELRIVVYREHDTLRAFPSIAKVAPEAFNPLAPNKKSLINNITTSSKASQQAGHEFMLPLANADTLALLGVSVGELTELCAACTHFVRFVLDELQDAPGEVLTPARGSAGGAPPSPPKAGATDRTPLL